MEIREKIKAWYLSNRRSLPWRETRDPYRIWIAEVILQQTRVQQGREYYRRFVGRFPDLKSLAGAEETEVLKVWEGLGFYSRARNMHTAARQIYNNDKGNFPDTYTEILKLPGVGSYTAAAVASMAFAEPRAVLDGNVHRVLSRLFGIRESREQSPSTSRIFRKAEGLLDAADPGTHNQALMELGALVCTPRQPSCRSCPVRDHCVAYSRGLTAILPARPRKIKRAKRYFHYLVIRGANTVWLGQRRAKDIWQGLYEFPLFETPGPASAKRLAGSRPWSLFLGPGKFPDRVSRTDTQVLSHQEIYASFYQVPDEGQKVPPGYTRVAVEELNRYPVPKLIGRYLNKLKD